MGRWISAVLAVALSGWSSAVAAQYRSGGSYELVFERREPRSGPTTYQTLVDEGYILTTAGQRTRALAKFIAADSLDLGGSRRFELLPQIAYLQLRVGDLDGARRSIALASAVYEVAIDTASCPEPGTGGRIQNLSTTIAPGDYVELVERACAVSDSLGVPPDAGFQGLYLIKLETVRRMIELPKDDRPADRAPEFVQGPRPSGGQIPYFFKCRSSPGVRVDLEFVEGRDGVPGTALAHADIEGMTIAPSLMDQLRDRIAAVIGDVSVDVECSPGPSSPRTSLHFRVPSGQVVTSLLIQGAQIRLAPPGPS